MLAFFFLFWKTFYRKESRRGPRDGMQEMGEERVSERVIKENLWRLQRGKGVSNFTLQWLSSSCDRGASGVRQTCGYNLPTNPVSVVRVHMCRCQMISGSSLAKKWETQCGSEGTALLRCLSDACFPRYLDPCMFLGAHWTRFLGRAPASAEPEKFLASVKCVHPPPPVFWDPCRRVRVWPRPMKARWPVSVMWELKPSLRGRVWDEEQELKQPVSKR